MKRLSKITPSDEPFVLTLIWEDGSQQTANLSGLVNFSRHFIAFSGDPASFNKVSIINWGHGIEWENGLDYSAENLARIANEQLDEDDQILIKEFQSQFKLTNEQTGQALGYKKSQIKNFKAGTTSLKPSTRIAIHTMIDNPTVLHAIMAQ